MSVTGKTSDLQKLPRIVLEDQRSHFVLDRNISEILQPAIRRDRRPVGAEQHFVLQQRIGVLDENRWKVFRRPAGHVDIDIRLVGRDG